MLLLPQRRLYGQVLTQLRISTRSHDVPRLVPLSLQVTRIGDVQIRLKYNASKLPSLPRAPSTYLKTQSEFQAQSKKRKRTNANSAAAASSASQESEIGEDEIFEVEEKLSPVGGFFAELINWRRSPYLLTILVNFSAFGVYCLWVYQAHLAASAIRDPEKPPTEEQGHYVEGPTKKEDKRFVTPGQEWLLDNFTMTPLNVHEGRYWTYFTSLFSHQTPFHLAFNMIGSHLLFTTLCPSVGTIPTTFIFLAGGLLGNYMSVTYIAKRGGNNVNNKYPGQFYGALGMSAANLSLLGFACFLQPKWEVNLWGMIPVKMGHVLIGCWVYETLAYFLLGGWDKIQSSVSSTDRLLLMGNRLTDT